MHENASAVRLLMLITYFKVSNNFTNASNILSDFPCSLTKISHKKNYSSSHGNHTLTMVLLLQIIIYKEVLRKYLVCL